MTLAWANLQLTIASNLRLHYPLAYGDCYTQYTPQASQARLLCPACTRKLPGG